MGAADVVPGVSGGTIAFITGIYDTLLESIRRINPSLLKRWKNEGTKAAFQHINGGFLIALFAGILTSIATLAKFISWALAVHPIPTWSFFFGLILISVWHIIRQVKQLNLVSALILVVGIAIAYSITIVNPLQLNVSYSNILFSGAIAICAMILPGISGSFILLLLGMYTPVLTAVKGLQVDILVLFALGCVIGLLCFSHLLSWLLRRFHDLTLMFLTGLMLGTLPKIWPWKQTLTWRVNSHGEQIPVLQHNLSPLHYESVSGHSSQLVVAVFMMLVACLLVLGLEKFSKQS